MQVTFENVIAVDKKCCWCCTRLGTLPPRVGVDVSVLQSFESILWDEMKAAIGATIPCVQSRPNMVRRRELMFLWKGLDDFS